jgi:hypothetical protein
VRIWIPSPHGSRVLKSDFRDTDRIPCPFQAAGSDRMTTFNIGFVIFPNLAQLDFTGPLEVLHRLPECKIHIVAKQ